MTEQPTLFDLPPQPPPRRHPQPRRPAAVNAPCRDCGTETLPGDRAISQCKCSPNCMNGTKLRPGCKARAEFCMVHDHVWSAAGMKYHSGYLCVGCIEQRLGRSSGRSER